MSAGARIAMALLVITILTVIPYFILKSEGRSDFDRLSAEVAKMKGENDRISGENEVLQHRIQAFRTNPRLIERRARERLHVARSDEVIFVFEPKDQGGPAAPTPDNAEPPLGESP